MSPANTVRQVPPAHVEGPVRTTAARELIAARPAISLAGLVREAELLTRVDRKYLVPAATALEVLGGVDPGTRVLEIDGKRTFGYDSVYFDTADHLSYRLTAQRRRRRFKVRTRSYLDTGGAFLEVKTKSGRGLTVKQRMPYSPGDRARLTPEGTGFVAGALTPCGHPGALATTLEPSLVSSYRRTTLLLPSGARATIDTALSWRAPQAPDPEQAAKSLPGHVIIETKSAGRASDLDRALWRAGCRPTGISKFGTGTALLTPELPSNKWARVLAGPFSHAVTQEPGETP